jgi:hypothetical protein
MYEQVLLSAMEKNNNISWFLKEMRNGLFTAHDDTFVLYA